MMMVGILKFAMPVRTKNNTPPTVAGIRFGNEAVEDEKTPFKSPYPYTSKPLENGGTFYEFNHPSGRKFTLSLDDRGLASPWLYPGFIQSAIVEGNKDLFNSLFEADGSPRGNLHLIDRWVDELHITQREDATNIAHLLASQTDAPASAAILDSLAGYAKRVASGTAKPMPTKTEVSPTRPAASTGDTLVLSNKPVVPSTSPAKESEQPKTEQPAKSAQAPKNFLTRLIQGITDCVKQFVRWIGEKLGLVGTLAKPITES